LRVEPAYDYAAPLKHHLEIDGQLQEQEFPRTDQVAAEIAYFSDCIRTGRDPEPSGLEGLADVRVIRALERSAKTGRRVRLSSFELPRRPSIEQVVERPPSESPDLLHARSPSGK
jgi:glucose-fructose oxidoreductase